MIIRNFLFLLVFISFMNSQAQTVLPDLKAKKTYTAQRIDNAPAIDGFLDEDVWKDLPAATNFVMIDPGDGTPIPEAQNTKVKILYDDEALYIGAYMQDDHPEKIIRQFTQRDNIEQSEFFLIDLNTYNDGENQTRFIVTAAGALADAKMSGEREDYNYNVVWDAEVSLDETGWYAEIKIPYAALRFPGKEEQLWGLQMARNITYRNETYVWNYINKSVGNAGQYNGLLTGIKDIDPPVRLSFYPYTSAEADHFQGNTKTNFSAGLDFKYGISDAFTLDATLIPDFGQTAFDDVELNLGPFEQAFGENRAFFTEGTELFTKGDLFYSRRIGDAPVGFNAAQQDLLNDEVIIENPERVDLLNALKISGRTNKDLGIGFFNAITSETNAIVMDTVSGESRNVLTEPLANYNIVVLDQQFNQNSFVTFINTNVTREGHFRDGNVTGLLFDIFNKTNSFNFTGEAKGSNVTPVDENIFGFASSFGINRTKGKFRYGIKHDLADENYDINDLGLNFRNNYNNFSVNLSYQIFEPTRLLNNYRISLNGRHQRRFQPDIEVGQGLSGNFFAMTRERFAFGGSLGYNSDFKDFFEPRREGQFVEYNPNFGGEAWISSDYRKKIAIDARLGHKEFMNSDQENYRIRVKPRFRFNTRFIFTYSFEYNVSSNRESFVALQPQQVIFGNRNMESVENSIRGSYNFSTKQAVNLSFRNFWSTATFADDGYSTLQSNGSLDPVNYPVTPQNDPNRNFNIWNLDLSYRWQFAPGSEAILLYRNSIFNQDNQNELDYVQSLENLLQEPLRQNVSLRIVYFIDYNNLSNIFKSKA